MLDKRPFPALLPRPVPDSLPIALNLCSPRNVVVFPVVHSRGLSINCVVYVSKVPHTANNDCLVRQPQSSKPVICVAIHDKAHHSLVWPGRLCIRDHLRRERPFRLLTPTSLQ